MAFEVKEASLNGAEGKGFAVILDDGVQRRCEGRFVFSEDPDADLMKQVVEGKVLTYHGPIYEGDASDVQAIRVVARSSDLEADPPYLDFQTVPGDQQEEDDGPAQQGDVTVHRK